MDADLGAMTVQRRDRLRVSPVTRWSRSFSDGESHGSNHEPPATVSSNGSAIHLVRASLRDYKKKNATQNLLDGLLMEALQRRAAGQSDGSHNLSATVAADRAFPAAVAVLGHKTTV